MTTTTHAQQTDFQDKLVRGLAHRMNNILSLFHGYLGLLMDGKDLDEETRAGLARIQEGADAATTLIDRTRSLAKPSSVVWREIGLAHFLDGMRPALQRFAVRNEKIEIVCPADLPALWTDAGRLRTAVEELVHNAIQASPPGGTIQIAVSEKNNPAPDSTNSRMSRLKWMSVAVADSGHGIPDQLAGRIFEPFFTTRNHNSIGLGLTVTQELARHLGGNLRFESVPGRTVFELLLPLRNERYGA